MIDDHRSRKGDECKKVNCVRYADYKEWRCGTRSLRYCMDCKWAHLSQYKKKEVEA